MPHDCTTGSCSPFSSGVRKVSSTYFVYQYVTLGGGCAPGRHRYSRYGGTAGRRGSVAAHTLTPLSATC